MATSRRPEIESFELVASTAGPALARLSGRWPGGPGDRPVALLVRGRRVAALPAPAADGWRAAFPVAAADADGSFTLLVGEERIALGEPERRTLGPSALPHGVAPGPDVERERARAELEELRETLHLAQHELAQARTARVAAAPARLQAMRRSAREALLTARDQRTALASELERAQAEARRADARAEALADELEGVRVAAVERVEAVTARLAARVTELEEAAVILEIELTERARDTERADHRAIALEGALAESTERSALLEAELAERGADLEAADAERAATLDRVAEIRARFVELDAEREASEELVDELRRRLDEAGVS